VYQNILVKHIQNKILRQWFISFSMSTNG